MSAVLQDLARAAAVLQAAPTAQPLDAIESFLSRFVAYPSEHARAAHALWIAHAHLMDAWGLDAEDCLPLA